MREAEGKVKDVTQWLGLGNSQRLIEQLIQAVQEREG